MSTVASVFSALVASVASVEDETYDIVGLDNDNMCKNQMSRWQSYWLLKSIELHEEDEEDNIDCVQ